MGVYWMPVNLTKKEYINPRQLGSGLSLREQLGTHPGTAAALLSLLSGRWRGDKIAMISDDERGGETYDKVRGSYRDVSAEARADLAESIGGRWEPTQSDGFRWNPFRGR